MATIAIGSVNIIAGIITTISQFLKIAELNEAHRASAVSWSKLYRNIKLELAKSPNERKQVINMLNNSKEEYDRLMETSPSISEKFIKLFKDTYSSNKEEKQAIFNNLNKPEVCGFIESTANSLYKAPLVIPLEIDEKPENPSILSCNENDNIEIYLDTLSYTYFHGDLTTSHKQRLLENKSKFFAKNLDSIFSPTSNIPKSQTINQAVLEKIGAVGDAPIGFTPCVYDAQQIRSLFGIDIRQITIDDAFGKISEVKEEARELAYAGALAAQPSLASVNIDEAKKVYGVEVALDK